MKNTTRNYYDPVDKQHYKKKYLLRKIEEDESERMIKDASKTGAEEVSDMQQLVEESRDKAKGLR